MFELISIGNGEIHERVKSQAGSKVTEGRN